jgi:hypothetical protein
MVIMYSPSKTDGGFSDWHFHHARAYPEIHYGFWSDGILMTLLIIAWAGTLVPSLYGHGALWLCLVLYCLFVITWC